MAQNLVAFAGCLAALFLLLLANAPIEAVEPGNFITDMAKAPFMAKFPPYDWPSPISCSATILSREHVMLSAHCLNATMRNGIKAAGLGEFHDVDVILPGLKSKVFVGAPDIRDADAIQMEVKAFAFPPGYPFPATPFVAIDPHQWVKDYAIAKLAKPLKFSKKVQPINLVKDFPPIKANDNRPAYILGWGGSYPYQLRNGTSKLAPASVCINETRHYYEYFHNTIKKIGSPMTQQQLDQVVQNVTEAFPELLCTTPGPSGIEGGNGGGPVALKVNGKFYEVAVMSNTLSTSNVAYQAPFVSVKFDCKWLEKLTKGAVKCKKLPRSSSSGSDSSASSSSSSSSESASKSKSKSAGDGDAANSEKSSDE